MTVSPNGTIWLTQKDGTIWGSVDSGMTFSQLEASGFSRIAAAPDDSIWAVGQNGSLWNCVTTHVDGDFIVLWQQVRDLAPDFSDSIDPRTGAPYDIEFQFLDVGVEFRQWPGQERGEVPATNPGESGLVWTVVAEKNKTLGKSRPLVLYSWDFFSPGGYSTMASDFGALIGAGGNFVSIAGAGTRSRARENAEDAWAVGANGTLWAYHLPSVSDH